MGLQRLLCGALRCYSRQLRLVFQSASTSTHTSPTTSNTANALTGLCAAHRQLTARRSLCTSTTSTTTTSSTQPSRDVTLFAHDRTRFFRLLSVFCGGQLLFWTYLGHFAYTGLRNTRSVSETGKTSSAPAPVATGLAGVWSFEMNLGSNTWRYGFTLGCLAIGAGIVGFGFLFCRRSVNQVVLHRGGRMVTVYTQSPLGPGRGRKITVPLSQVACHAHRHESPSFIPLRIKGHKFYFLLDKEGTVNNARLFDVTVGAYRPF